MAESIGVFGAVKGLFEYNRENFIFDRTLNQQRVYQIQKMRVAQVKLYRDDLKDLFSLTIRKMDSYLILNALLWLFTGGLFYEGRLPLGTPAWLLWLWTMSLGSAFFFLSLSIWFAIHASITAQTFQVRLLTQWLRLPIPSANDIHAVSGGVTDFEETRARDMLRVPGVTNKGDAFRCIEKYPDVPNALIKSDIVQDYTLFVEHFYLFRDLQKHWQGFDAYARIGMVVGTNMLLSALSYMSLAYFLMSFKNVSGLVFPFIFTGFQLIHLRMNLRNLTVTEKASIFFLVTIPILLASIAGLHSVIKKSTFLGDILSPLMFAASGLWVVFLVLLGSEDDGGLPCRFVTVASIDVLGLDEDDARFNALSPTARRNAEIGSLIDSHSSDVESERDGAETPVAIAVPPAPVISRAEERRRSRTVSNEELKMKGGPLVADGASHATSIQGFDQEIGGSKLFAESEMNDMNILAAIDDDERDGSISVEQILRYQTGANDEQGAAEVVSPPGSSDVSSGNLSVDAEEGIAPVELNEAEEIRAYKSSVKARMLPWKGYREAGAVLVCLWIFATTYSVLASFQPRWGWPRTLPYGDGEEGATTPVSAQAQDPHQRVASVSHSLMLDTKSDYGKVTVWSSQPGGGKLFVDAFDVLESDSVELRGSIVVICGSDGTCAHHELGTYISD